MTVKVIKSLRMRYNQYNQNYLCIVLLLKLLQGENWGHGAPIVDWLTLYTQDHLFLEFAWCLHRQRPWDIREERSILILAIQYLFFDRNLAPTRSCYLTVCKTRDTSMTKFWNRNRNSNKEYLFTREKVHEQEQFLILHRHEGAK